MRDAELLMTALGGLDDALIEKTGQRLAYSRAQQAGAKQKKTLARVWLIAAVLLLMLALSAFAWYTIRVAEGFRGYFGELDESQEAAMEELGSTAFAPIRANGTCVTPLALIGNDDGYYIRLRFEAPEGQPFAPLPEGSFYQLLSPEHDKIGDFLQWDGERGGFQSQTEWFDETPGDEVIECVLSMQAQYLRPGMPRPGKPVRLHIQNLYLQHPDKHYSIVLDGPWEIDLSHSYRERLSLPVEGLTTVGKAGSEIRLEAMTLSPLALGCSYTFSIEGNDVESADYIQDAPGTIAVVLDDGSTAELTAGDAVIGSAEVHFHDFFTQPVNLSRVAYVQFGDLRIPVIAEAEETGLGESVTP